MIKSILMMYNFLLTCLLLSLLLNPIWGQALTPYFNYTITESDQSLWGISKKHNVTVEKIKTLNQKTDDAISVGDVLKIPKETPKDDNFIIHTVKKSDKNLWQIGLRYNVKPEEIVRLNRKESTVIKRGDRLKIPKNNKYIIHIVSNTDKSLWGICKIYDVAVEDVMKINNKKNDIIRRNDQLIIPKDNPQAVVSTNIEEEIPSINANSTAQKAAYDFEANKWRFPYHNRRDLHIFPSIKTGFSNYYKLNAVEYAAFFQNSKDYSPNKEQKDRYFYSIETPFVKSLDNGIERYITLGEKEKLGIENGYSYDFITIIEVDSAANSFKILPVFLIRDAFGSVKNSAKKGAFTCCADPFPLASYSRTDTKEIISYSKLLRPSIIRYTEVVHEYKNGRRTASDSTILILQLETNKIPSLIDKEEFKNGKKVQSFSNYKRRTELSY